MLRGGSSACIQGAVSGLLSFRGVRKCRMVSEFRSGFIATFRRSWSHVQHWSIWRPKHEKYFSISPRIGSQLPPRQVRRQKAKILIPKFVSWVAVCESKSKKATDIKGNNRRRIYGVFEGLPLMVENRKLEGYRYDNGGNYGIMQFGSVRLISLFGTRKFDSKTPHSTRFGAIFFAGGNQSRWAFFWESFDELMWLSLRPHNMCQFWYVCFPMMDSERLSFNMKPAWALPMKYIDYSEPCTIFGFVQTLRSEEYAFDMMLLFQPSECSILREPEGLSPLFPMIPHLTRNQIRTDRGMWIW
jgi:hypothetical protein